MITATARILCAAVAAALSLAPILVEFSLTESSSESAPGLAQEAEYWRPTREVRARVCHELTRVLVEFDVANLGDQSMRDLLADAKRDLLGRFDRLKEDIVQSHPTRPFLSFELSEAELAVIEQLKSVIRIGRESVRLRVEASPNLFPATIEPAVKGGMAVEKLLIQLGALDTETLGKDWTIIIVDGGVDPDSGSIPGAVVDGSHVAGSAVCLDDSSMEPNPHLGDVINGKQDHVDHGTVVAAMASWAAPAANLVSIRVGDGKKAPVPDVIAALVEVNCQWRAKHPRIAGVVLSMANKDVTKESHPSHFKDMTLAIVNLYENGIPVVIAAGNDGLTGGMAFPASIKQAISVAMTDNTLDKRASKSNWSDKTRLCAPGMQVEIPVDWSVFPASFSGTSVAAPLVLGAIARLREAFPQCKIGEIISALEEHGTDISVDDNGTAITVPLMQIGAAFTALSSL